MKVRLRAGRPSDIEALFGNARPPFRCRLLTAELAGKLLGIGGLVLPPDGTAWATLALAPGAERYCVALMRAWVRVRAAARASGHRGLYAKPDPAIPKSERFMRRLGFRPIGDGTWFLPLGEE